MFPDNIGVLTKKMYLNLSKMHKQY